MLRVSSPMFAEGEIHPAGPNFPGQIDADISRRHEGLEHERRSAITDSDEPGTEHIRAAIEDHHVTAASAAASRATAPHRHPRDRPHRAATAQADFSSRNSLCRILYSLRPILCMTTRKPVVSDPTVIMVLADADRASRNKSAFEPVLNTESEPRPVFRAPDAP